MTVNRVWPYHSLFLDLWIEYDRLYLLSYCRLYLLSYCLYPLKTLYPQIHQIEKPFLDLARYIPKKRFIDLVDPPNQEKVSWFGGSTKSRNLFLISQIVGDIAWFGDIACRDFSTFRGASSRWDFTLTWRTICIPRFGGFRGCSVFSGYCQIQVLGYGVATISRLLKIMGLFYRIQFWRSLLQNRRILLRSLRIEATPYTDPMWLLQCIWGGFG